MARARRCRSTRPSTRARRGPTRPPPARARRSRSRSPAKTANRTCRASRCTCRSGWSARSPAFRAAVTQKCNAAENNTGGCPAESQIGTATAGAGPGPHPFFNEGKVYLTGPYKGAPFGLAVVDAGGGRTVQPRQRGRPLGDQHRSAHRGRDGQRRSPAADHRWRAAEAAENQRERRQVRVHAEPDQLLRTAGLGDAQLGPGRERAGLLAVRAGRLHEPAVPPDVHGDHGGANEQNRRREPQREDHLPAGGVRERREKRDRTAHRAALAADDDPESLRGHGVRSQPRHVPRRFGDRARDRVHAAARSPAHRAGLPGLPRQPGLPRHRDRAPGRRRHGRTSTGKRTSKKASPKRRSNRCQTRRSRRSN